MNDLTHSKFSMKVAGMTLKVAIYDRIHRQEEVVEAPAAIPGTEAALSVETSQHAERLLAMKFIADNLVDDASYEVTLDDLLQLTTVQEPILPKIFMSLLPLLSMLKPSS